LKTRWKVGLENVLWAVELWGEAMELDPSMLNSILAAVITKGFKFHRIMQRQFITGKRP